MNILIVTPLFIAPDINKDQRNEHSTRFLYDYAEEWMRNGHSICVFHTLPTYPRIFLKLAKLLRFLPRAWGINGSKYTHHSLTWTHATLHRKNMCIIRSPFVKYIPHALPRSLTLSRLSESICSQIDRNKWKPDVILSDFISPSLSISHYVRNKYNVPLCQIFHQTDFKYAENSNRQGRSKLTSIDCAIFRSQHASTFFHNLGINFSREAYMYSGVSVSKHAPSPRQKVNRLIFAGKLRKTKNVQDTIQAIAAIPAKQRPQFEIIGDGEYRRQLEQLTVTLNLSSWISFSGQIQREQVLQKMENADCLVMVSKETFGLAYIEAMSCGCIPIAAKNEGIDGIIKSGFNGFLVDIYDITALTRILQTLITMERHDLERLSNNAIQTASNLTHEHLAHNCIELFKGLKV